MTHLGDVDTEQLINIAQHLNLPELDTILAGTRGRALINDPNFWTRLLDKWGCGDGQPHSIAIFRRMWKACHDRPLVTMIGSSEGFVPQPVPPLIPPSTDDLQQTLDTALNQHRQRLADLYQQPLRSTEKAQRKIDHHLLKIDRIFTTLAAELEEDRQADEQGRQLIEYKRRPFNVPIYFVVDIAGDKEQIFFLLANGTLLYQLRGYLAPSIVEAPGEIIFISPNYVVLADGRVMSVNRYSGSIQLRPVPELTNIKLVRNYNPLIALTYDGKIIEWAWSRTVSHSLPWVVRDVVTFRRFDGYYVILVTDGGVYLYRGSLVTNQAMDLTVNNLQLVTNRPDMVKAWIVVDEHLFLSAMDGSIFSRDLFGSEGRLNIGTIEEIPALHGAFNIIDCPELYLDLYPLDKHYPNVVMIQNGRVIVYNTYHRTITPLNATPPNLTKIVEIDERVYYINIHRNS